MRYFIHLWTLFFTDNQNVVAVDNTQSNHGVLCVKELSDAFYDSVTVTWFDSPGPEGDARLSHTPLIGGALPTFQRTRVTSVGHAHQFRSGHRDITCHFITGQ